MLAPWKKNYDKPRQHIKKQKCYITKAVLFFFFPLESFLDRKETKPVNLKWNQSWISIGRTDVEAEVPILWPPNMRNWLIGKDTDSGKDWRQEEKGTTEVEMVGWHHQLNGQEFEQAPGVGDGQGSLSCCSPWHCKECSTTEQLNWTDFSPLICLCTVIKNQLSKDAWISFWTLFSVALICLLICLALHLCFYFCSFLKTKSVYIFYPCFF